VAIRHLNGEFWGVQYHPEYDLHELARLTYCRRAKLVELGFFPDMKTADYYVDDLENLHIDPSRYDIAWRLGIDADVMDETIKNCETRNFIKHLALPHKAVLEGKN
jgi:GMP synthase (glutamine-hydrolysing)